MGLDMYAYTRLVAPKTPVDFAGDDADLKLHTWRKHPNLHGWMEDLYRQKGGTDGDFNCANLRLDEADLDQLEADLRAGKLPPTSGFFFGVSDGSELADDLDFIAKARAALAAGNAVYYTSWW